MRTPLCCKHVEDSSSLVNTPRNIEKPLFLGVMALSPSHTVFLVLISCFLPSLSYSYSVEIQCIQS